MGAVYDKADRSRLTKTKHKDKEVAPVLYVDTIGYFIS